MPIKTVLVAGTNEPNNHFVNLCLDNFLKPTWIGSDVSPRTIPKLDAAILAIAAMSHGLQDQVKDVYSDRKVFIFPGPVSTKRQEFEEEIWGEGTLQKMRSDKVPFSMKVYFVLGRFFNRGDTISMKPFKEKIDRITKGDSGSRLSTIFSQGKDRGMFGFTGKKAHQSSWVFKGLTQRAYDDMLKHGFFLEKDCLVGKEGKTEILTPQATVPDLISVNAPEPAPDPIPDQAEPSSLPEIAAEHPALELLLEQSAKQDAKIEKLIEIVMSQQKTILSLEERIYAKLHDTLTVHDKFFQLDERLRGLDGDSVGKIGVVISSMIENFMPRRPVSPISPRQLS